VQWKSRRTVCVEKRPEAQAEQAAGVPVFSSRQRAETLPRGGAAFFFGTAIDVRPTPMVANKLRAHFSRSGGMFGTIGKFATSSGLSRNAAGYLSGLVFSSGSVERQAYRQVLQR